MNFYSRSQQLLDPRWLQLSSELILCFSVTLSNSWQVLPHSHGRSYICLSALDDFILLLILKCYNIRFKSGMCLNYHFSIIYNYCVSVVNNMSNITRSPPTVCIPAAAHRRFLNKDKQTKITLRPKLISEAKQSSPPKIPQMKKGISYCERSKA